MDDRSKNSLIHCRKQILDRLRPTNVLDSLRYIFTVLEWENLRNERYTETTVAGLMLDYLSKKSQADYKKFVDILKANGYKDIAKELESFKEPDPPVSIISTPAFNTRPESTPPRVLMKVWRCVSTNTEPDPPGASSSSRSSTSTPSIPPVRATTCIPPSTSLAAPDPPEENPSPSSNSTPTPSIQPASTSSTVPGIGEPSTTKKQIFISYRGHDKIFASNLRDHLEEAGYSCWIDFNNIRGGSGLYKAIADGIFDAGIVIFCISNNYIESDWCEDEVKFSFTQKIRGIPLVLDDVSWPPNGRLSGCFTSNCKYMDFRQTQECDLQFYRKFMLLLKDILLGDGDGGLHPSEKDVTNRYRNWFKHVATDVTNKQLEVLPSPTLNYEIVLVSPEKAHKDTSILLDIFNKAKIFCWHRSRTQTGKGMFQEADEIIKKAKLVVLYLTNDCHNDILFMKQFEMAKDPKKQLKIFPLILDDVQLGNTLKLMLNDKQAKRVPALNPEELDELIRECQEIQRHSTLKSRFNYSIPGNVLFISSCAVLLAIVCSFIYKK